MATAKRAAASRRTIGRKTRTSGVRMPGGAVLLALLLAGGLAYWWLGDTTLGHARAGTAYGAKNACSCRYISGRDLASCYADFVPGMEVIFLSEDTDARSVTASVPLVHAETASYRDGFGCVLDPVAD